MKINKGHQNLIKDKEMKEDPKQKEKKKIVKHRHRFKLAQVTKEANFRLSMAGIYQDKAYVICEDCGLVKTQWI